MRLIYVCSPYRSDDPEEFRLYAEYLRECMRRVVDAGDYPIAPHHTLTAVLADGVAEEREIGIRRGLSVLERCDELLLMPYHGISEGMEREIRRASELGLPIMVGPGTFDPPVNAEGFVKNLSRLMLCDNDAVAKQLDEELRQIREDGRPARDRDTSRWRWGRSRGEWSIEPSTSIDPEAEAELQKWADEHGVRVVPF